MASMGYYIPGSQSDSYVANKRNERGEYAYDSMYGEVGIQEQAALQSINKDYANVIENAYSQYLSAKQGIMGSAMGQGYKEAYMANQQQAYLQNIAEANTNAATVRQQIAQQADASRASIDEMYNTEVANFDRLQSVLSKYYDYQTTLSEIMQPNLSKKEQEAWANESHWYIDKAEDGSVPGYTEMYDRIFEASGSDFGTPSVYGYQDTEGVKGKTLDEWIRDSYLSESSDDQSWWQWYLSGGKQAIYDKVYEPIRQQKVKEYEEQEQRKKEAEERVKEIKQNANLVSNVGQYKVDGSKVEKAQKVDDMSPLLTEIYKILSGNELKDNAAIFYNGNYYQYKVGRDMKKHWYQITTRDEVNKTYIDYADKIDTAVSDNLGKFFNLGESSNITGSFKYNEVAKNSELYAELQKAFKEYGGDDTMKYLKYKGKYYWYRSSDKSFHEASTITKGFNQKLYENE